MATLDQLNSFQGCSLGVQGTISKMSHVFLDTNPTNACYHVAEKNKPNCHENRTKFDPSKNVSVKVESHLASHGYRDLLKVVGIKSENIPQMLVY